MQNIWRQILCAGATRAVALLAVLLIMALPALASVKKLEWNNIATAIQTHDKLQSIGLNSSNQWVIKGGDILPDVDNTHSLGSASYRFNALFLGGAVDIGDAAVSQATNINTGVTINAASGVITTQSASTAALTAETGFTVTDSAVGTASVVIARVTDYSGTLFTNGQPDIYVDTVAAGSFHVRVVNRDPTHALSGTMKIPFAVL
ncbi:MAG: hypothetical protein ACYCW6_00005 [Candidatus Xenobia bacterium]